MTPSFLLVLPPTVEPPLQSDNNLPHELLTALCVPFQATLRLFQSPGQRSENEADPVTGGRVTDYPSLPTAPVIHVVL